MSYRAIVACRRIQQDGVYCPDLPAIPDMGAADATEQTTVDIAAGKWEGCAWDVTVPDRAWGTFKDHPDMVVLYYNQTGTSEAVINVIDYPSPQRAIDAAIAANGRGGVALRFPPGTYNIAAPLVIANASNLHVDMRGAVLRAAANMDVLLDINGMAYSTITGGWFTAAPGVTVGTMLRYGWTGAGRSSTRNRFTDMMFEHGYVTGMQVGRLENGLQNDNSIFENLAFIGGSKSDKVMYQTALAVVQGSFGNTMLHTFRGVGIGAHKTAVLVDRVRHVRFEDFSLSDCATDFDFRATNYIEVTGTRSEDGERFLVTGKGVTYPQTIHLRGCTWDSPTLSSATLIDFTQGTLTVDQFQVGKMPVGIVPRLSIGSGSRNAYANITGLRVASDENLKLNDLFPLTPRTNINLYGFVRTDSSGGQIDAECVADWRVRGGKVLE